MATNQIQKIFADVISLIDFTIEGLSKDYEIEKLSTLYNHYQYLIKTYDSGKSFKNGTFSHDINSDSYQNTTSFDTPIDKWVFFTKENLKRFNDDLLKFVRSFWIISFPYDSDEYNFLVYNLGRESIHIPQNEYDNKIKFNVDCSMVMYEYMVLKDKPTMSGMFTKELCQTVKYNPSDILENLILLLDKLTLYKEFLEVYFLEHFKVEKMFLKFREPMVIKVNDDKI